MTHRRSIRWFVLAALSLVLVAGSVLSSSEAEARGKRRGGQAGKKKGKTRHRAAPIPALRDGKPNIQAQSAVVVDLQTGEELFAKNADDVRPVASISKLMAALVLVEKGVKLEGTQTITKEDKAVAFKGPIGKLHEGFEFRNVDLLHAALIASDNRALPALGRSAGMTAQQLSAAMTERARALGLKITKFEDPTGLNDGNVSTARELVVVLKSALANPIIKPILQKKQYEVRAVNKPRVITYNNTDRLVGSNQFQVLGGKTGYTDLARYCLVIAAKIRGRDVAMAFLHAEGKMTRFADFHRVAAWLALGDQKQLDQKRDVAGAPSGTEAPPKPGFFKG
jgi:D-alanyl-D-alanine endopeptidase (penicillin-binding protein 7)